MGWMQPRSQDVLPSHRAPPSRFQKGEKPCERGWGGWYIGKFS